MWKLFRKKKPTPTVSKIQETHFDIENSCSIKTIINYIIISTTKLEDNFGLKEEYWTSVFPYNPANGSVDFSNELYFAPSYSLDAALSEHMRVVKGYIEKNK